MGESPEFKTRDFDLGDILSVTTGRLVSPRHMDGVYDILGYMTGVPLMTHQLPRAAEVCAGPLLLQHPQLGDIHVPPHFESGGHVDEWLQFEKTVYGETLTVAPLADGVYEQKNPLIEAAEMMEARGD